MKISEIDKGDSFLIGFVLALALVGVMSATLCHNSDDISSGEQFIMGNSTYVCKKTNELKGHKDD